MKSFSNRLKYLIDAKGFNSINEFSVALGYKSSEKLSRLLRSPSNKPSFDILVDIANKFEDVRMEWLLTGKGLMYHVDVHVVSEELLSKFNHILMKENKDRVTVLLMAVNIDVEDEISSHAKNRHLRAILFKIEDALLRRQEYLRQQSNHGSTD